MRTLDASGALGRVNTGNRLDLTLTAYRAGLGDFLARSFDGSNFITGRAGV